VYDPYADEKLVDVHLKDLDRFVQIGRKSGALVRIVPFDITVGVREQHHTRYRAFVRWAEGRGLPICSLEGVFERYDFGALRVNSLDAHPNALANRLAAQTTLGCLSAAARPASATIAETNFRRAR
jgi:hypothetical protein